MAIFPSQAFTKDNIKARWEERYTSEALNKKFLGIPRGVYAGFIPQVTPGSLVFTLGTDPVDGLSLIRVESGTGLSASMIDIIVTSPMVLDFTGHATWPVYVVASANYQVGQPTSGQIFTRQTAAANPSEVTVCKVDRPGNTGDLIVSPTTVFPTNDITSRQEPYAFGGTNPQKFGFMPEGSYEALLLAEATTEEVIASRQNMAGVVAPVFDPLNPQTTGLPERLSSDLSGLSMSGRLGFRNVNAPGNSNYSLPGAVVTIPLLAPVFIVGDFVTTSSGVTNAGIVLTVVGTNITIDVTYGTFPNSGTITNYPAVTASTTINGTVVPSVSYINVSGSFSAKRRGVESPVNFPGADTSITPIIPVGALAAIDPGGNESVIGAITSNSGGDPSVTADTTRNTCQINRGDTGVRLTDVDGTVAGSIGATVYGRLDYVSSATATTAYGKDILPSTLSATFVQSSPTVVLNTNPVGLVSIGDIIQLPVNIITLTLSSSTGFNLGDRVNNGAGATGIIRSVAGSIIIVTITAGTWAVTTGSITDSTTATTTTYSSAAITAVGDGRFYEVTAMDGSPKLTIFPAYAGPTTTQPGNLISRRRYKLNFVRNVGGTEVPVTFTNVSSIPLRFFFPAWFSLQNSTFDASLLMKIPGETLNDATTTAKGRTLLAPNNSPGGLNTANDTKAGMITNVQQTGVAVGTGNYHTINFVTASGVSAGGPGIINVASTGPVGPTGPTGPPGPSGGGGGSGPAGPGFSNRGPFQTADVKLSPSRTGSTSFNFTFTPLFYMACLNQDTPAGVFDAVWITGVTIVGNNIQVAWTTDDAGSDDGYHFSVGASAAG